MKIALLVYHDILDDRIVDILEELKIDSYTKWENTTGKFEGAEPHLGTRTFPGHESVRLLPFKDEEKLTQLIKVLEDFNKAAHKSADQIRLYSLPLEKII